MEVSPFSRDAARWSLLLAVVVALVAATMPWAMQQTVTAAEAGPRRSLAHPHAAKRVIVGYEPGAGPVRRANANKSVNGKAPRGTKRLAKHTELVKQGVGQSFKDAMAEIGGRPGVAYV